MAQDKKKPKWGKPKLIVIVRDAQERVLANCKYTEQEGAGALLGSCATKPPETNTGCAILCALIEGS